MFNELRGQAVSDSSPQQLEVRAHASRRCCPACEAAKSSSDAYFSKTFGAGASVAAISELIADGLGFCSRHGQTLINDGVYAKQVARAYSGAIAKIRPLLQQSVIDERCQHLFFSAGHRCPACSAEDAAAAKALSLIRKRWLETMGPAEDVDALCWSHFETFVGRLAIEPRGQAIQQHLDVLLAAGRSLERSPRGALSQALALLGHSSSVSEKFLQANAGTAPKPMNGFLGDPYACPVCVAIGDASSHWLEGLRWAADDVAAGCLWLFAPCCKRHVCEAARLGRPDLVARVASFALSGLAEQARQQVAGIVRELALAEQPKPVWYRPRRRRREASAAGIQPGKRFILRCRGCEAEAIALERASGTFLDLMRHARYRELLARGHGLCLQHLAHILPVAPPDIVRPFLGRLHAAHLETLQKALLSPGGETVWLEAVRRFKGWSMPSAVE